MDHYIKFTLNETSRRSVHYWCINLSTFLKMETELDRIAEIFHNRTVFITGGSGFIGKAFIEKLLRVTEVKKIYVLIRSKKGKSPSERLNEIFNNVLFKLLLETKPDARKKCQHIDGDVSLTGLGIAKDDREMLKTEVDFIVHSAATTRFDESIRQSIIINTRGTKYALDLAEECEHLKTFQYVDALL
ncbi:hypothetical protein JTB14_016024 [Gonioctena quinquepunctata]|nr:hypothetical protein JTB14_016024 [Gonioctena quinquepunctata]